MPSSLNKIKRYPKCELHKEFDAWLMKNAKKFTHPPYSCKLSQRGAKYKFEGVIGKIQLYMNHNGSFMVMYYDANRIVEIIVEFDACMEKTKSGNFYSSICLPRHRRYFSSKSSLLGVHCFKPLIEWTEENFKPEKSLLVLRGKSGWGLARVMDTSAANRKKKYVKFRSPVVTKTKNKERQNE